MRFGITVKLFLVLLCVSAVVALAAGLGSHVSFSRGFLGYLNGLGVARIEALLPSAASAYESAGDWEFLRGKPQAWFRFLRGSHDGLPTENPPPRDPQVRPAPTSTEVIGIDLRIGLLDAGGAHVAGNPEIGADAERRAIIVNGETVGWLAVVPFERVSGAANLSFERHQRNTTWIVVMGAICLAALVAWWVSRRALGRLNDVTRAVHRLAEGDYTARAPRVSHDEIGQLAEDCNQLAHALQRTEDARRQFTADISHELRTPLSVLAGELEALEDGIRQPTPESIRSLQGEVRALKKLVDDLYQLSMADVGAMGYRMQPLDLRDIVTGVAEQYRERLATRRIRLEVAAANPLRVQGDADRLKQLLRNLLENVYRYAAEDGVVSVEATAAADTARITVDDSGPGVPDELRERLFERFYRVEGSRSRQGGGAGLGLALCRSIVDAHQGTIVAEPSPLGGLRIAITLPLSR